MSRPRRIVASLCVVAGAAVAVGCSTGDAGRQAEVTTTGVGPTQTSAAASTATSTSAAVSTTASAGTATTATPQSGAVSVAVYWSRPYGTAQPIEIPAYHDPSGGPFPYVMYGSVTNSGAVALDAPEVSVDWSSGGASVYRTRVAVLDADGTPVPRLEPGASGDLLVVVDDEQTATRIADISPTFGLAS